MPWTPMDEYALKLEFVCLALKKQISFAELCRRFVISRQAGYELMSRYEKEGEAGLVPRSRRPKHSPRLLTGSVEEMIVALRKQNPRWGGRKIRKLLDREGVNPLTRAAEG